MSGQTDNNGTPYVGPSNAAHGAQVQIQTSNGLVHATMVGGVAVPN
jgi:hypothetical protein